jgi:rhodanese-related sulfurtransferase
MKLLFLLLFPLLSSCANPSSEQTKREQVLTLYKDYKKEFPNVPEISPKEVTKLKKMYILVDVREEKEQKVSMIPHALTLKEFEKNKEQFKNHQIVTYCTIGYRSGKYAQKLRTKGYQAYNMTGAILLWTHDVGTLVNDNGMTKNVHVYGSQWNLVPDGFQSTY